MRLLPTFILFMVLASLANGQSFEITPKTKTVPVDKSDPDVPHYIEITNTGTKPLSISWEKITVYKTDGWDISVCDCITCYSPTTYKSPGKCTINPGAVLEYKVIAYPNNIDGHALVNFKAWEYDNEQNTSTVEVYFNGLVSTEDPGLSSVSIFPNPVKDILSFDNIHSSDVRDITIYNAMGAPVKYIPSAGLSDRYNIEELNDGLYFVKISSKDNRSSEIRKFIKSRN